MYLQQDKDYPHHATIIRKIENNMIFYAAHTNSQEKKPLFEFFDDNKNGIAYILKIEQENFMKKFILIFNIVLFLFV